MDSPIMMLITAFIGVAIMLAIAVTILNGVQGGFDCKTMTGYNNASGITDDKRYPSGTWAGTCHEVQTQTQQSLQLIIVILVVIAAVAILVVVRML